LVRVDLGRAIAGSLEQVMPMAIAKDIDLGLTASVQVAVTADPEDVQTLVTNLVENAIRHTPKGGTVDVSLKRSASEVVLEVRDTGPGIPEHLLERAFERFFKVNASDEEGGSGLGLSLVRAIVQRYGGRIALANGAGPVGLIATVSLPLP
jgi:two-component system OmpR family sensor kinase